MTDKELKKLKRVELLELLVEQVAEMDSLKKQLEEAKAALESREFRLKDIGSIAQASLEINEVFTAAQRAAQDYLDNIRRMEGEQAALLEQTRKNCGVTDSQVDAVCGENKV